MFDLDDTLLINDMETFSPHYFRALVARVAPICPPEPFVRALNAGTRAMLINDGGAMTNAEVFEQTFFARVDCDRDEIMPVFDAFYAEDFERLKQHTSVDPIARELIDLVKAEGYQVAIATQPLFPLVAIKSRLRWANVGAEEIDYDFISCYEIMTACKPHPQFFATVLAQLDCQPDQAVMVGDNPEADMGARQSGLRTFWVDRGHVARPSQVRCDQRGNLRDLYHLVESGGIHGI